MGRLKAFLKIHLKRFMTEKEISKDDARKILQEYLMKNVEITEQEPAFGAIYKSRSNVCFAQLAYNSLK